MALEMAVKSDWSFEQVSDGLHDLVKTNENTPTPVAGMLLSNDPLV